MSPEEFKSRLLKQQTKQPPQHPAEPLPASPRPTKPLAPQCPAEQIEDNGLRALYCLEDEGHDGQHRFERSECR